MSYELIETSRDDGRPIELFEISYSGNYWRYTSADREITYLANTYTPIPCSMGDLEPTADPAKSDTTFTFPFDAQIGEVFRVQPPSEVVSMTVFGQHFGDTQFIAIWKGRVVDAQWEGPYLRLTGESVFSSLRRPGLRLRYQYQCPHALYGQRCGVNRDAWKELHTLTSFSGVQLQVAGVVGKPDNYFAGGYVTWVNQASLNIEKRMIRASVGASGQLTLSTAPIGLSAGQIVTLYPGCDHTLGTGGCARFDNEENFGGTPFIPSKNPFGGTPIY